jgi:hypothetical protein
MVKLGIFCGRAFYLLVLLCVASSASGQANSADGATVEKASPRPQKADQMPEWALTEIEQIRAMVHAMKECKPTSDQMRLQKNAVITETMNIPISVVWDVSVSDSIRAPYSAYIEGVSGVHFEGDSTCQKLPGCVKTVSFVNSAPALMKRFEFDISPDGLSFRRKLTRKETETSWSAEQVAEGRTCWDDVIISSGATKR